MNKISVIIPVKNGEATLARCFTALRQQTIKDVEIIVLDSESTDDSVVIAKKFGASVYNIPASTFNHGLTRNEGVKYASGKYCFFTVQDAWIAEVDMLEKMMQHFIDPDIMGVVGHQAVPHDDDKNPLLWYKRFSIPNATIRKIESIEYYKSLTQLQKQKIINWDNVVSMYRHSALLIQPFKQTQFAEDWIWSQEALLRGWVLIHDPLLIVYHYHHQGYNFAYKVAYAVNYHFYLFFGFLPSIPNLPLKLLKILYHISKHKKIKLSAKIYWIWYNILTESGTFFSHLNFLFSYKFGGKLNVKKRYNEVCKSVPQGKIKANFK